MNYKLLRSEYYNEEHKLNAQETKEFYLSVKSPYYRVRALSYALNSEIFGKRENLQHEISLNLFHKEIQIPNLKDIHKYYNQDLFEKKFGLNENFISENINNSLPIYIEIPEINQMRKDISYNEIFNHSSLMITDYSSVAFDFAYPKKPLIYYHSDNDYHFDVDKSYFKYDTMGFGPVCKTHDALKAEIINSIENKCQMEEKYIKRVDGFFKYIDKNNSERVIDAILDFDKTFYY